MGWRGDLLISDSRLYGVVSGFYRVRGEDVLLSRQVHLNSFHAQRKKVWMKDMTVTDAWET